MARWSVILVAATALAAACTPLPSPQVLLRPDVTAPLPELPLLPGPWHSSQLLTVQARGQEDRLPVEIELNGGRLVVIAFTTWGGRVLTVTYDGRAITAEASGPGAALPPPSQVIADVLMVNWPIHGWSLPPGWRFDQQFEVRRLRDAASRVVAEVRYPEPGTSDDIQLVNNAYGYRLSIRTLSGDAPMR
ncbi:MAG TPA: DUF3261 domain-containing protein [bacterium]